MNRREPLYKLGPIQRHRRFPDGYDSMSKEEKLKADSEFYDALKLPLNVKSEHFYYYAEIIWDDEMYKEHAEKTRTFIEKAKKTHGDTYDYSRVNYITNMRHVEIICDIHGPFFQYADNHINGNGCPKCGSALTAEKKKEKRESNALKEKKQVTLKEKETKKNEVRKQEQVELAPTLFDVIEGRNPKPIQTPVLAELMEKINERKKEQLRKKRGDRIREGKIRAKERREQAERMNNLFADVMLDASERVRHEAKKAKITEILAKLDEKKKEQVKEASEQKEEKFVDGIREGFDDFLKDLKNM